MIRFLFSKKPVRFFLVLILLFPATCLLAQSVKRFDIKENNATAKTKYPVLLMYDTKALVDAGKMDAGGTSIRFSENCDGTLPLFFWIESGINTTATTIWVRIPLLPASGTKKIYMAYSNTAATNLSNFDSTFVSKKIVTTPEVIQKGILSWNYDWIELRDAGNGLPALTLNPDHEGKFTLQARKILIKGEINGDSLGYKGGDDAGETGGGPGGGDGPSVQSFSGGGGAGYGGKGGNGGGSSGVGIGGDVYGESGNTVEMGSGGGVSGVGGIGGDGGAAFSFKAASIEITSTGSISVNGGKGSDAVSGSGGGSGGGILLQAKKMIIAGPVSAKGGKGGSRATPAGSGFGGGGGGGGRVKIYHENNYTEAVTPIVIGGVAGSGNIPGAKAGSAGSITYTSNFVSPEPSVTEIDLTPHIWISTDNAVTCPGQSVTFKVDSIKNGGTAPQYKWKKGTGDASGANTGTTYIAPPNYISTGDKFYCILTPGADACASSPSAASNEITMTMTNSVLPAIFISADKTTMCSGETVQLKVDSVKNEGPASKYQWQKDGIAISGATSSTYTSPPLTNTAVFTCVLESNDPCASPKKDTSDAITITVNKTVPLVTITASDTIICPNQQVTFTADTLNGGSIPEYRWEKKNGSAALMISDQKSFVYSSIQNNDTIYCVFTSAASCAQPNKDTSGFIIMKIEAKKPEIYISSDQSTVICTGTQVTFVVDSTKAEGPNPEYKWYLNGDSVANTTTYVTDSLKDNDTVYCMLISDDACVSPSAVISDTIVMTVSSSVIPVIQIKADKTSICKGDTVQFSIDMASGGGSFPSYTWMVNNDSVATGLIYKTDSLQDNDSVCCKMVSSLTCAAPDSGISDKIGIHVYLKPGADFTYSPASVYIGTNVQFTTSAPGPWDWDFGDGSGSSVEDPTHTYTAAGPFTVTLNVMNGPCDSSVQKVISVMVGLPEYSNIPLKIIPNPSSGNFMLELDDHMPVTSIEVLDICGQLVYKQSVIQNGRQRIVLPEPAKGLYIVRITTRDQIITARAMVN